MINFMSRKYLLMLIVAAGGVVFEFVNIEDVVLTTSKKVTLSTYSSSASALESYHKTTTEKTNDVPVSLKSDTAPQVLGVYDVRLNHKVIDNSLYSHVIEQTEFSPINIVEPENDLHFSVNHDIE